MIKSFRGLLADGGQDTIRLSTNNGLTGYKIKKFDIINNVPGTLDHESVVKIYTREQTTIDGTVNFEDGGLLGVAFRSGDATSNNYPEDITVIFDNTVFNQDVFITHKEVSGNAALMNYYLELEQVKLDLGEATVATLKDMRGTE